VQCVPKECRIVQGCCGAPHLAPQFEAPEAIVDGVSVQEEGLRYLGRSHESYSRRGLRSRGVSQLRIFKNPHHTRINIPAGLRLGGKSQTLPMRDTPVHCFARWRSMIKAYANRVQVSAFSTRRVNECPMPNTALVSFRRISLTITAPFPTFNCTR
jgi:hypothetical protein